MSNIVDLTPSDDGVCLFCNSESNVTTISINKRCRNFDDVNVITFDICDACRVNLCRGLLPKDSCIIHVDLATMES